MTWTRWYNVPPTTAANKTRPPITPPAIAPIVAPLAPAPAPAEVLATAMPLDGIENTGLLVTIPGYPAETNEVLTAAIVAELLRLAVRAEVLAVALLAL